MLSYGEGLMELMIWQPQNKVQQYHAHISDIKTANSAVNFVLILFMRVKSEKSLIILKP